MKKKLLFRVGLLSLFSLAVMAQTPGNLSTQEIDVYNQHQAEVNAYVRISAEDQMAELRTKYIIQGDYLTPIKQLVLERELHLTIYNFIYPDSAQLRNKVKQKIKSKYEAPITRQLLLAGASATTENFNSLLKIRGVLKLTTQQIDTIIDKAVYITDYLTRHPHKDLWAFELNTLNKVLSDKQMDMYLSFKNEKAIKNDVKSAWNRLKVNNMTTDLDSIQVSYQLYSFYNNIHKASDLYSEHDSLKREAVKAINNTAPIAINRLHTIKKNQKTLQSYNSNYVW